MKLRIRFAIFFTLNTLLGLSLFGGTYYFVAQSAIVDNIRRERAATLDKMTSVCREMRLASNAIIALNYIRVLKGDPSIVSAACLDAHGVVQAHSESVLLGRVLPAGQIAEAAPVLVGGNKVGFAVVFYDPASMEAEVRRELGRTMRQPMLVAGFTFLASALIGLALAWSLSRPIGRLVDAAQEIGAGNLSFQTPLGSRKDELGLLAGAINEMARRLRGLDEMKDAFVTEVSHELRSPMAAIHMYAQFMLNEDPDGECLRPGQRKKLATIMDNALRLKEYVTNILDAAKIKAGRMEYHARPVRLEPLVSQVRELFGIVARQHDVEISVNLPQNLPAVSCDPERLLQVLANLVSNALKFTKANGRISISARAVDARVEISVRDTGKGIPPEAMKVLFHRFEQTDVAAQKEQGVQGTGLGLYIVGQVMSAMGGRIRMESEPGKGTEVTLDLPEAT